MTMLQWADNLKDKIDGWRTMSEATFARQCYEQGLSVNKTQKAIEQMRSGKSN